MSNKNLKKVYSKNYLKMNSILWLNSDLLLPEIIKLRKKFGITEELEAIDPARNKDHYDELIKQGSQEIKAFFRRIKNKTSDFYKDLEKIREKLKLGREWNTTLLRITVSGIFLPPPFSVFIEEDENKKIIIFELNKDTTQDDLILAWKNSKEIRERFFGKARATFPTKKTLANFNKIAKYQEIKYENKSITDIATNGKEYQKSTLDVIGEIYSEEDDFSEKADKKRLNKLKTAKHRQKKL